MTKASCGRPLLLLSCPRLDSRFATVIPNPKHVVVFDGAVAYAHVAFMVLDERLLRTSAGSTLLGACGIYHRHTVDDILMSWLWLARILLMSLAFLVVSAANVCQSASSTEIGSVCKLSGIIILGWPLVQRISCSFGNNIKHPDGIGCGFRYLFFHSKSSLG